VDGDETTLDYIKFTKTQIPKVEFSNWFNISEGVLFEFISTDQDQKVISILNYIVDATTNTAFIFVADNTGTKCDKLTIVSTNNICTSNWGVFGILSFNKDKATAGEYKTIEELRASSAFYLISTMGSLFPYDNALFNKK